jgi:hypothetical protein
MKSISSCLIFAPVFASIVFAAQIAGDYDDAANLGKYQTDS